LGDADIVERNDRGESLLFVITEPLRHERMERERELSIVVVSIATERGEDSCARPT
jgi:hypothetical protein